MIDSGNEYIFKVKITLVQHEVDFQNPIHFKSFFTICSTTQIKRLTQHQAFFIIKIKTINSYFDLFNSNEGKMLIWVKSPVIVSSVRPKP